MSSLRPTVRAAAPIVAALCACAALAGTSRVQGARVVQVGDAPAGIYSEAIEADGLIYVSGIQRPQPGSGIEAETRRVLDRLTRVLEAAGSSRTQVASVSVFLKRAADFEAMNIVYREYFAADPPARIAVSADLADGALVQVSAIAVPSGAARESLRPAGWLKPPRPYSYAVRAGGLVFLSGLVSRRGSDDSIVPGSVGVQTRTILENAGALLKTAGLKLDDVVAARVFLTDDSLFDRMNDEYRRDFLTRPPARSTAIADLMSDEAQVEIAFIASTSGKQVIGPQISPTVPVAAAVQAGNRIFLSGVLGSAETSADDVAEHTRDALLRIGRTLDAAGVSFADVVDSTVYLSDLWQRAKFDEVFAEWFPRRPPARTLAGAKLSVRRAAVEIQISAVKP